MCVSKPVHAFGISRQQSAYSLSQVPSCHLGSWQAVWSGYRNQKPGKGAVWWTQAPPIPYMLSPSFNTQCRKSCSFQKNFKEPLLVVLGNFFFFFFAKAQTDRYFSSSKWLVTLPFLSCHPQPIVQLPSQISLPFKAEGLSLAVSRGLLTYVALPWTFFFSSRFWISHISAPPCWSALFRLSVNPLLLSHWHSFLGRAVF